jgi:hypothetical protein
MSKSLTNRSGFYHWLYEEERKLRGDATRPADIQKADIKIPVVGVSVIVILLAVIYGFCMGIFALVRGVESSEYERALMQTFASMCKVPLLFVLTLVVTFPSLYVFNALVGSKLRVGPVLKLLVASLAVNLAVLASMGPILAFFSVSTPNYPFIVLLNVVVFGIAGVLGLVFLIQTLNRLAVAERGALPAEPTSTATGRDDVIVDVAIVGSQPNLATPSPARQQRRPGPLDHLDGIVLGHHVRKVFGCWIIVFGLVGAQMGWVLRPFIGAPNQPFQWFRARHSNFFEAVTNSLFELLF